MHLAYNTVPRRLGRVYVRACASGEVASFKKCRKFCVCRLNHRLRIGPPTALCRSGSNKGRKDGKLESEHGVSLDEILENLLEEKGSRTVAVVYGMVVVV